MSLLEKITDLINQVSNEAEKTDKRKLIDEVAGIMKSGGCDDELIRTAIAKMEKIGYDESEAGSTDNCGKKAKNADEDEIEEEFEEEKEIADNKKAKNEEKEEVEEEKEEVKNKCKNSMDDVRNVVFGGSLKAENSGYISKAKRLEMGNKY